MRNHLLYLMFAGITVSMLTGCGGGQTDRPLTVRVSIRFDYIGDRDDPQPLINVYYSWDDQPGELLLQRTAGTGSVSVNVQRSVDHGRTYILTVWAVRNDTGESKGVTRLPIAIPESGNPPSQSIDMTVRQQGEDGTDNGYEAVLEPLPYY